MMQDFLKRIGKLPPKKVALLAAQLRARLDALEHERAEPIAIIGMSCRFPASADSPDAYWRMLRAGEDTVREIPASRWDVDALYDPDPDAPGKMSTRWAALLDQVDTFDAGFFGIAPKEAASMDPQQRLLLELAWEALERAGLSPERAAGSMTGVFVGISGSDYFQLQQRGGLSSIDAYAASGNAHSVAAGRLSFVLGLQGPSIAVDTACSSSLVAMHLAVQSLRSGECGMALAGGVNLILSPETSIALSKSRMMAPHGRCMVFDAAAEGFVRGEGGGLLVLKRLSDAQADGDTILALIRGAASNQDGRSNGLTAPNGPAQEAVVRAALTNAGLQPADIGYVEAHGTGTSLGDPIEVQALAAALGAGRDPDRPLLIGSVKANIGHLESAAGVAGLIKLVLAVRHGVIPPQIHLRALNPHIPWSALPVSVPTAETRWPGGGPRLGGVSSFGFSGTNAHVIVGEAPPPPPRAAESERSAHVLMLSARSDAALREVATRIERRLGDADLSLADACFTANTGRSQFAHRLAVVAGSSDAARESLRAFADGGELAGGAQGVLGRGGRPKIAFLFTGQGAQYVGMGRELYRSAPVFRAALERCAAVLEGELDLPLLDLLYPEAADAAAERRLAETAYTQPALFALEYALAELWRSWGITPAAVLGHSVGELVAVCIAGVLTPEDGLRLVARRARLMQALPAGGAMAAVFADEAIVAEALAPHAREVAIAAVNGPDNVVISGAAQAVQDVVTALAAKGVMTRPLKVSHAFHSPLMDPMLDALAAAAGAVAHAAPRLRLVANASGRMLGSAEQPVPADAAGWAAHWRRQARVPVRFADGVRALHESGCDVFLEVGPGPTLVGLGRRCVPAGRGLWLTSLRARRGDWTQLLESVAALAVRGAAVDWTAFDRPYDRRRVVLPTYPFQRERFWLASTPDRRAAGAGAASHEEAHGSRVADLLYEISWRPQPPAATGMHGAALALPGPEPAIGLAKATWLVLADRGGAGERLAEAIRADGDRCIVATDAAGYRRVGDDLVEIDATDPAQLERLLRELPAVDGGVVHLWALDSGLTEAMSAAALAAAQRRITGSVLHLAQALARTSGTSPPRLWLVTRGAQPVGESTAPADPLQATIWGLSHTLALEHPELCCSRVDLDPDGPEGEIAHLMSELRGADGEDQIALRGRSRAVRRLTRAPWAAEAGEPLRFREDGSYLITGGLGGIGLEVAEWMAERGAGHLVLMGRSGASPVAQAVLRRLEQRGAGILVAQGDVAEREQLRAILDRIARELPPLRGVMHAAGVLDDGVLLNQTWRRFEKVMAPKVIGSWHLHTLTRDLPLDFFVLFSSGVGLLGAAGQGNYAAANAFMDALAFRRQGLKLPALTVNWGAWSDVGLAAGRSFGAQPSAATFTPGDGLRALERAMQRFRLRDGDAGKERQAQVAVLAADWERLKNRDPGRGASPLLSELTRAAPEPARAAGQTPEEPPVRDQLAAALPNRRKALLQERVTRLTASVLGLQEGAKIDVTQPLQELGLDSLMALDLRNRLGRAVDAMLPVTLLFEYPTVRALTGYLSSEVLEPLCTGAELDKAQAPAGAIALPDDQIAARLLEKLNRLEAGLPPQPSASP